MRLFIENVRCGDESLANSSSITINVNEADNVSLKCSANYYGSWAPNVTWLLSNGTEALSSGNDTLNNNVTYSYDVFRVNRNEKHVYNCSMKFDAPPDWLLEIVDSPVDEIKYDENATDFVTFCGVILNVQCK